MKMRLNCSIFMGYRETSTEKYNHWFYVYFLRKNIKPTQTNSGTKFTVYSSTFPWDILTLTPTFTHLGILWQQKLPMFLFLTLKLITRLFIYRSCRLTGMNFCGKTLSLVFWSASTSRTVGQMEEDNETLTTIWPWSIDRPRSIDPGRSSALRRTPGGPLQKLASVQTPERRETLGSSASDQEVTWTERDVWYGPVPETEAAYSWSLLPW